MSTMRTSLLLFTISLAASLAHAGSPKLTRVTPPGGQRGTTIEAYLHGKSLEEPRKLHFYEPGLTLEAGEALKGEVMIHGKKEKVDAGTRVRVKINIAADCPLGPHGMRLRTAGGVTEYVRFFVGPFPSVEEDESSSKRNDKIDGAKAVALNSTLHGKMLDASDVDLFQIQVKKGERISAELESARLGVSQGVPDLYVAFLDADGKKIVEADDSALYVQDPILAFVPEKDGACYVQVRHAMYNASGEVYRLHVGNFSRPTGLYPAGGQAGKDLTVQVLGDPKGAWSTKVKLPATPTSNFGFAVVDPKTGSSAPTPNKLCVSPFGNVLEAEPNNTPEAVASAPVSQLPMAFNGVIEKPGDVDCFRFKAKKGDRFKVVGLANAFGSPLDPTIWIKPLEKKGGSTLKATDSRANQLGIPPATGAMRETLDPVIEFNVPVDGEYVLGVEDDRGDGGSDYVYRVEFQPETDAVYTYIAPEAENQQAPQNRQVVSIAAGNYYNAQVSIFSTNRPFTGEMQLVAVGLPEGVAMFAPPFKQGMTKVPMMFRALPDTKPQAVFVDLVVKPVGDDTKTITSGYRQVVPMNLYGNDGYMYVVLDKLLVAVTEPAPFSIEVEEPKSALVQNGETSLKFKVHRAPGNDQPVTVNMEYKPNGVNTATPITVKSGQTEGEYLLSAAKNASAGTYLLTLTAVAGASKSNYYDTSDRTYIAAHPFKLSVAEPHLEGKIGRTSIERGKTADLVCKLTQLKPFPGKAKATLARLPRGVVLETPTKEITSQTKEVTFKLRATDESLVGSYQGVALEVTVVEDGQATKQLSGYGTLRVDAERGAQVSAN